jgi:hypothetical protein
MDGMHGQDIADVSDSTRLTTPSPNFAGKSLQQAAGESVQTWGISTPDINVDQRGRLIDPQRGTSSPVRHWGVPPFRLQT